MWYPIVIGFTAVLTFILTLIAVSIPSKDDEMGQETLYRILMQGFAKIALHITAMKRGRITGYSIEERIEQHLARKLSELKGKYADLDYERQRFEQFPILYSEKSRRSKVREKLEKIRTAQVALDYAYGLAYLAGYGKVAQKVAEGKIAFKPPQNPDANPPCGPL